MIHKAAKALAVAALLLAVKPARAHALDPAVLHLRELAPHRFAASFHVPALAGEGRELVPVFPSHCARADGAAGVAANGIARFTLDCGARGLDGESIRVDGLASLGEEAIVHVERLEGPDFSAALRVDAPSVVVPGGAAEGRAVSTYCALGIEHILTGYDHLLFVLGLLLLVRGPRALLGTITAFTLAHSITLSLTALGLAHAAPAPVEACIALSILLLAVELSRPAEAAPTLTQRSPWAIAFAFGLLHGFGFAGALAQIGLPAGHVPAALLAFNVGVEIGQLAFVGLALAAVSLMRGRFTTPPWRKRVLVYGIGSAAAFLCFARIAVLCA